MVTGEAHARGDCMQDLVLGQRGIITDLWERRGAVAGSYRTAHAAAWGRLGRFCACCPKQVQCKWGSEHNRS